MATLNSRWQLTALEALHLVRPRESTVVIVVWQFQDHCSPAVLASMAVLVLQSPCSQCCLRPTLQWRITPIKLIQINCRLAIRSWFRPW
jgi:hypothetical protein